MSLARLEALPDLIDQVHDRLLAAVVDGSLAPGERLTQESVAARLGVSRQPVSHALQLLKRRGLLVEHGKRGLAVAPLDAERIRDLYQVREALEVLAAGLAAQRAGAGLAGREERQAAEAALAHGASLGPDAPIGDLVRADVAFHSALHRLSGNAAIAETVADQWPHFMRSIGSVLTDAAIRRRVWQEHADILRAVLAGDRDGAERLMRRHMASAREDAVRRLAHKTVA
jgi:DNA-binding GntR family transcriptional regulator